MNTAEWIALFTCIATWLYVILVARTLFFIHVQTVEFGRSRKLQNTLTIFKELQTKKARTARSCIYEQVPKDTKGIGDDILRQHLTRAGEAFVAYDRIGYMIKEEHVDPDPIIATHWAAVWRCWKKSKRLIAWARKKRGEPTYLEHFEYLFGVCESHRKSHKYRRPKID